MEGTPGEVITIDSDSEDCDYSSPLKASEGCYIKFHLDGSDQLQNDNNDKDNGIFVNNKPIKNLTKIINENDLDMKEDFAGENFGFNDAENSSGSNNISEESNQSSEAIENNDNKKYKCDECSKSYKTAKSLQKHEKIHGITTFECDRCNKCFSQSSSLINHRQTHPPLECSHCFLVFSSQMEFNEHEETHAPPPVVPRKKKKTEKTTESEEPKPDKSSQFICHVCNWDSKKFVKLRAHCHKSHKIVIYQCNYCLLILRSKEEKEKHKDYECPKNEFKCRSCLKRFPYDSTLKRHRAMCDVKKNTETHEIRKSIETQTEKENVNEKENESSGDDVVVLSD